MKIILYLILFIVFCSCSQKNNKKLEKKELESAIENAENIKDYRDRIFMDFKFGMSKEAVNNHFYTLLDSGKITLDSDRTFKYSFQTKHGNISTSFLTKYYDGKLCEFVLRFSKIDNSAYLSPELIMQFAQDVFHEKAMKEGYRFYIDSIEDNHFYYYIKGATIVKFSSFVDPCMAYICAPLVKLKKEDYDREAKQNVKNTESDL